MFDLLRWIERRRAAEEPEPPTYYVRVWGLYPDGERIPGAFSAAFVRAPEAAEAAATEVLRVSSAVRHPLASSPLYLRVCVELVVGDPGQDLP